MNIGMNIDVNVGMSTELQYLVWVTILTGLLWIPYVLDRISVRGLTATVGYPANPKAQSAWAARLMKAHANAVENLVVFAALVLIAHAVGISNTATAMASLVFFWARLTHAMSYTFAIPWLRTLAFVTGFGCQATLAWQLIGR